MVLFYIHNDSLTELEFFSRHSKLSQSGRTIIKSKPIKIDLPYFLFYFFFKKINIAQSD